MKCGNFNKIELPYPSGERGLRRSFLSQGSILIAPGRPEEVLGLLDREQPPMWSVNKKKTEFRPVPIAENLALIYNELGVYAGVRLRTPCGDL